MAQAVGKVEARRVHVWGVVQGVGFRPFVYRLARDNNLNGWVCNTSGDVTIELEGEPEGLARFLDVLKNAPPPQSHVEHIDVSLQAVAGYDHFEIRHSEARAGEYQLVSPDLATCADCRREIFDPADRRHGYPFTNCTNCGPRFTIIEDIPYDRPLTTMRKFSMCPACQHEYGDSLDRRFHAQPNACTVCGPALELVDACGNRVAGMETLAWGVKRGEAPFNNSSPSCPARERGTKGDRDTKEGVLDIAAGLLQSGKILAVKGLGGFLLACDATNEEVVKRLRARKHRLAKPFAVMIETVEGVREHCQLGPEEEKLLTSPQSPIVLLARQPGSSLAPAVAPGLRYMGVMLPYTPLHYLLMRGVGCPLVMTSGNLSEEPIAKDNDEALRRLKDIADYFLLHNRDIYSRYDDSVTMVASGQTQIVRRARGYAPYPVPLTFDARPVLACGAELKNTFCLTKDRHAFVGQHIGDMENLETLEHFEQTEALYEQLFRIKPEIIACDLHPDYLPTRWAELRAKKEGLPLVYVQHHFAHIVSCLADNATAGPVIGVALDGTGYGTDGKIWGGEFLVADYRHFERKAHLEYLPLPGGAAAIQKPYRIAIGYLYALLGADVLTKDVPCLKGVDQVELDIIRKQIDNSINTPLTSSCGRLFDAVSALLGVRREIEYEGQAAIELEMAADDRENGVYPLTLRREDIALAGLFAAILDDLVREVPLAVISARFHNSVARMVSEVCSQIARDTGIRRVALSGGVFQNRCLLGKVMANLEAAGLSPLVHRQVPCNDGGISLGQAVAANYRVREGV